MSATKIVLLVVDGVGGLPLARTGKTELETAHKPNLDSIASEAICGLVDTVGTGITPGSAPGHLSLFGYNPIRYDVGRGVLEAVGIDTKLAPGDVAARGNFCTVDGKGVIIDRRAGRISTEENARICRILSGIKVKGCELQLLPVKEHRFVLILRGEGLSPGLTATDPQQVGLSPRGAEALFSEAERTAGMVNDFVAQAEEKLRGERFANMVLMRGFSSLPDIPTMPEIYKLKAAAIAVYPMYRGLARLVGMEVLPAGEDISGQMESLHRYYADYDFFFIHFKKTDSRGEDGDFEAKVQAIEELDSALPSLLDLRPEVLVVTGDHSTPANLSGHSWHPVPFMLRSRWCRPDRVSEFSELACLAGGMGRFPATEIMPLAMANALKLDKFGA